MPAATGTDTGGSIRQPAALCGLTGIKPTYGRVSRWGMIAFASSLDQGGPICRNAEDCALLLDAMSGYDEKDTTSLKIDPTKINNNINEPLEHLNIGIVREFKQSDLSVDSQQLFSNTIKEFENLGAKISEISLPNIVQSVPTYYVVAPAECSSNFSSLGSNNLDFKYVSHEAITR